MSVIDDSTTDAESKNKYDSEFSATNVADTNGELQAAASCVCSDCTITVE